VFQNHIPKRWADRAPRLVIDAKTRMQAWKWDAGVAVGALRARARDVDRCGPPLA
jgi:hypothetical protein